MHEIHSWAERLDDPTTGRPGRWLRIAWFPSLTESVEGCDRVLTLEGGTPTKPEGLRIVQVNSLGRIIKAYDAYGNPVLATATPVELLKAA